MGIIETHFHLDYLKEGSHEEILKEASDAGVSKLITISVSPDNLDTVLNIANTHENVFCSQGIHPHEAKLCNVEVFKKVRENLENKKVIAIGEIGLDYHYNNSPKDQQIAVFQTFLEMAIEVDLPVIIHSRDADEDMIKILNEFAPRMSKKGVIHSFTSGSELAKIALSHGFYIGFNGIITFKNAQNVRDILSIVPLDKVLVETDSPFLTPAPHRGKENAPKYLPFVIQKIADEKNNSVEEVIKQTNTNAINLFAL